MKSFVNKPWGSFEIIDEGAKYKVKKIIVNPGGKLSLQSHKHRSEHWLIASGSAEVILDEKIHSLGENDNIFIPQGSKHRLTNPGKIDLSLIEVQSGSYVGEDDIVRFEDMYGRTDFH